MMTVAIVFSILLLSAIVVWLVLKRTPDAADAEIIGYDDVSGKPATRADVKRFSGNSHDRRIQRRAYGRQEKTPLS